MQCPCHRTGYDRHGIHLATNNSNTILLIAFKMGWRRGVAKKNKEWQNTKEKVEVRRVGFVCCGTMLVWYWYDTPRSWGGCELSLVYTTWYIKWSHRSARSFLSARFLKVEKSIFGWFSSRCFRKLNTFNPSRTPVPFWGQTTYN